MDNLSLVENFVKKYVDNLITKISAYLIMYVNAIIM